MLIYLPGKCLLSLEDAEILIERVMATSTCPLKTSTRERKEQKRTEREGKGKGEKGNEVESGWIHGEKRRKRGFPGDLVG